MGENREGKQSRTLESVCCLGRVIILLTTEQSKAQGKDWTAFKMKMKFFLYNVYRNCETNIVASPPYLPSLFPKALSVQQRVAAVHTLVLPHPEGGTGIS